MRSLEEIVARNFSIAQQYIAETPPRERLERRVRAIAEAKFPADVRVVGPGKTAGEFELHFIPSAKVRCDREQFVQRRLRAFDTLSTPEDREWFANLDDPGWTEFPSPPAPAAAGAKVA